MNELEKALVDYARHALAAACGQKEVPLPDLIQWADYEGLLGPRHPREAHLSSIFSRVAGPDQASPPVAYYAARELALNRDTLFPRAPLGEESKGRQLQDLWERFEAEHAGLQKYLPTDDTRFLDAFYYLFYRWAWALPCDYGEPGVSLFEQWKAIAALAFASHGSAAPAKEMTLVGGDIPGIQEFVYTITSKGAAKGLRGRSLFIQLLGDAVVRRLVAELGLSLANVVYNAGGNFLLLAPREVKETVDHVREQVSRRLVEAFQGETAVVLECMPVRATNLFAPPEFRRVRSRFGEQVALAKSRALYDLARSKDGWQEVFAPQGKGSKSSCVVCRKEADESNSSQVEGTELAEETVGAESPEPARICHLCHSFARLARDVAHEHLWMSVKPAGIKRDSPVEGKDGWQQVLACVSGLEYEFTHESSQDVICALAINQPHFLEAPGCGFRLLANVTPVVEGQELQDLEQDEDFPREEIPQEGDIRSFELLARAARKMGALPRVGVLRMDADGLGAAFSDGMSDMTLPAFSSMSAATERFFNGYLNVLVKKQSDNDLYIIYAGGDDLFIVGAWPHLPELAESIRDDFKAYLAGHPTLSLSGGITLEGEHFPLYRAAERAEAAEQRAKHCARADGRRKDTFCFLGTAVPWEDWPIVRQEKERLLWLIGESDNAKDEKRLPRALLHLLQSIYSLYVRDLQHARRRARKLRLLPPLRMVLGRWMWMQVYHLARLAERSRKNLPDAPQRIMELQKSILNPDTVCYSGLAARWTEYLTRKERA